MFNFCQYPFYHWFDLNVTGLSKSSNVFFFYLFIPVDGILWHARVSIFNAFNFQRQVKSKMKNPLLFLMIFLFFINYIYAKLIYLIPFFTFCCFTNIYQLVEVEILFLLYIKTLLYFCGDIEFNPGPK